LVKVQNRIIIFIRRKKYVFVYLKKIKLLKKRILNKTLKTIIMKNFFKISFVFIFILTACNNDDGNNNEETLTFSSVSTFATGFNAPTDICVDTQGNFFVTDQENHCIKKITPSGQVTVFAGQSGVSGFENGTGSTARFNKPHGICIDMQNNLYVTDFINHAIRKIEPDGEVTTMAGSGINTIYGMVDGIGAAARFHYPEGIAIDTNGNLYVADYVNDRVRKITQNLVVTTFAGSTEGYQDGPANIAQIDDPTGVGIDAQNNLFVTDSYRIRKITTNSIVSTFAGNTSSLSGLVNGSLLDARFNNPSDVCFDSQGTMYIADFSNNVIRVLKNNQVSILVGDVGGIKGDIDGSLTDARFDRPSAVLFYNNKLYVVDKENNKIKVVQ
jgi:sugar lactone lactonase YvrE